jgi:hypothetical protein
MLVRKEILINEDILELLPTPIQDIVEELDYKKACGQPNKRLSDFPPS